MCVVEGVCTNVSPARFRLHFTLRLLHSSTEKIAGPIETHAHQVLPPLISSLKLRSNTSIPHGEMLVIRGSVTAERGVRGTCKHARITGYSQMEYIAIWQEDPGTIRMKAAKICASNLPSTSNGHTSSQ